MKSQHDQFPAVSNAIPMAKPYREAFERLAAGRLRTGDRDALRAYILVRAGGRLAALNAVRELKSDHLDELMDENT